MSDVRQGAVQLKHIFFWPSEHLVARTDARTRRAINFWLLVLWLLPGTTAWIVLRDALWFVGFMSLYAIWITHFGSYSAETPVEAE